MPKQLPKDVSEEDLERQGHTQSIVFLILIIIEILVAFFLDADLVFFWTFLSMLQIVVYMPIIQVNLPPNTEIFLESMRHVAEFEPFNSHGFIKSILKYNDAKNPLSEQYKSAGFISLNFLINMEYFLLIGLCFGLFILAVFLVSLSRKLRP